MTVSDDSVPNSQVPHAEAPPAPPVDPATAPPIEPTDALPTDEKDEPGLLDKAKAFFSDEKIDSAAASIKDKTPDNVDSFVDKMATKAKGLND